jgi:lipoprotein-anchoring transpeptidase ErfK/SrfK
MEIRAEVEHRRFLILPLVVSLVLALALPVRGQEELIHVVQRGENLYRIALRYGTTYWELAAANGIANPHRIYVGQRLAIPGGQQQSPQEPAGDREHVVRRGENLYRIALRYGISYHSLAAANGIRNPALIYVGQVLRIPGGAPDTGAPTAEPTPPPAEAPGLPVASGERWIDIDLSDQTLVAYEGETAMRTTAVSTGITRYPTPTGRFSIRVKYLYDDMTGPGYYLPDVPFSMYFHRAFAIHGTYWHSNFGTPMSHGCINLPTPEAEWLFYWVSLGTPVVIHD